MGLLDGRVRRMERARRERKIASRAHDEFLMRELALDGLERSPDLAIVEPRDTDAETYREIQHILAHARGDFAAAGRLEAQGPLFPPSPGRSGDARRDSAALLEWHRTTLPEHCLTSAERAERAMAAARARVGRSPTADQPGNLS